MLGRGALRQRGCCAAALSGLPCCCNCSRRMALAGFVAQLAGRFGTRALLCQPHQPAAPPFPRAQIAALQVGPEYNAHFATLYKFFTAQASTILKAWKLMLMLGCCSGCSPPAWLFAHALHEGPAQLVPSLSPVCCYMPTTLLLDLCSWRR